MINKIYKPPPQKKKSKVFEGCDNPLQKKVISRPSITKINVYATDIETRSPRINDSSSIMMTYWPTWKDCQILQLNNYNYIKDYYSTENTYYDKETERIVTIFRRNCSSQNEFDYFHNDYGTNEDQYYIECRDCLITSRISSSDFYSQNLYSIICPKCYSRNIMIEYLSFEKILQVVQPLRDRKTEYMWSIRLLVFEDSTSYFDSTSYKPYFPSEG